MRRARTIKQKAWTNSVRFRAIALAALQRINTGRSGMALCGARKRSDGSPCRNPALANGRCRFHGGRTPKGAGWHKPRFPEKAAEKFLKKELELERRKRKREVRLRSMTPEQRAAHEEWKKTHRPGSAAARARARQDREAGALISKLLAPSSEPPVIAPEEDTFA